MIEHFWRHRSRYPLYSRLTKTTTKTPCFSKSGDATSIGAQEVLWFLGLIFLIRQLSFLNMRKLHK